MHGFAIRLFVWSLKPRVPASCSMVVKQALPLVPGVRSRLSGLVTPSQMTQTWSLAFGHRVATMGLGFNDCFISIGSYPRPEIISFLTLSVASLFVKKSTEYCSRNIAQQGADGKNCSIQDGASYAMGERVCAISISKADAK